MSEKITVGKVWKKKSVHSGGGWRKDMHNLKTKMLQTLCMDMKIMF